jgi:hypothetical protein
MSENYEAPSYTELYSRLPTDCGQVLNVTNTGVCYTLKPGDADVVDASGRILSPSIK